MVYIGIYWDISPLPRMEIYMEHHMEDCMEATETSGCIGIVPSLLKLPANRDLLS